MIVGGTGPGNNLSLPEHRRGTLVTGAAQGARLKIQTKQKAKYSSTYARTCVGVSYARMYFFFFVTAVLELIN